MNFCFEYGSLRDRKRWLVLLTWWGCVAEAPKTLSITSGGLMSEDKFWRVQLSISNSIISGSISAAPVAHSPEHSLLLDCKSCLPCLHRWKVSVRNQSFHIYCNFQDFTTKNVNSLYREAQKSKRRPKTAPAAQENKVVERHFSN